jgi:DNA-binding transcriptional LysR family regulator
MELRHLRYFVAVAEELNFRRAAERLHVSQPPLSRQIRDLETEVGHALFDRDRGGVRLTEVGRIFLRGARRTLDEAAQTVHAVREAARGRLGELSVGTTGSLSFSILPAGLVAFRMSHPHVEVEIREMTRDPMIAALAEGRIDLALVTPTAPFRPAMKTISVYESDVVVALPPGHRLGRGMSEEPLDPMELARETLLFIRPEFAQGYLDWVQGVCRGCGFVPHLGRGAESREGMIGLIAAGYGCALAPAMIARSAPIPGVVVRPLIGVPRWQLLAAWMERGASRYVRPFIEALRAVGEENNARGQGARRKKKVRARGAMGR